MEVFKPWLQILWDFSHKEVGSMSPPLDLGKLVVHVASVISTLLPATFVHGVLNYQVSSATLKPHVVRKPKSFYLVVSTEFSL